MLLIFGVFRFDWLCYFELWYHIQFLIKSVYTLGPTGTSLFLKVFEPSWLLINVKILSYPHFVNSFDLKDKSEYIEIHYFRVCNDCACIRRGNVEFATDPIILLFQTTSTQYTLFRRLIGENKRKKIFFISPILSFLKSDKYK